MRKKEESKFGQLDISKREKIKRLEGGDHLQWNMVSSTLNMPSEYLEHFKQTDVL